MNRLILLDSGPLGMVTNPKAKGLPLACQLWLKDLLRRGVRVAIPEIADYEVRRELLRAGLLRSVHRLDSLKQSLEYIPIQTDATLLASSLWAEARQTGQPTADSKALDGDVILSAQARLLSDETFKKVTEMQPKPIAVVGAGPTGAMLGLLLAERGIPVVLIEASRNFRRVFRGEGLMPSGLEALAQMGLLELLTQESAQELRPVPNQPIGSWEFVIEDRSIFSVDEPMGNDRPCTLVAQPQLLETVIDRAKAFPNFRFISGETVQSLALDGLDQRVSSCVLSSGETIETSLVIGCDGRTSAVRKLADLFLDESSKPFNILWFKLPDTDRIPASNPFTVFVKGDAVFSVFRSSEGLIQVGWTVQNDDWKAVTDWSETLAAASPPWLANYFRSKEIVETIADRPVLLTVTVGYAPQWSRPGCLLLGDAAHPMSPIRAQGINMALRDAIVATNYLVKAWNSGTPPTPNSGGFDAGCLDQALIQIQADREPEIRRIQKLQSQEAADGAKLHHSAALRQVIKALAPALGPVLKQKWLLRQRELRSGVVVVKLEV